MNYRLLSYILGKLLFYLGLAMVFCLAYALLTLEWDAALTMAISVGVTWLASAWLWWMGRMASIRSLVIGHGTWGRGLVLRRLIRWNSLGSEGERDLWPFGSCVPNAAEKRIKGWIST